MKYVWLIVVICGFIFVYLGYQREQLEETGHFGEYPCFLCTSVKPDYEVLVFSKVPCAVCEKGVLRAQTFCRLTGITYGGAFYDDAEETFSRLEELGLELESNFLLVILKDGAILKTSTNAETVETFLSEIVKEESDL